MSRISKILRWTTVGIVALAAVAVVTGWSIWGRGDGAVAEPMPDFATLTLRGQPNEYLALPPDFAATARPHAQSPTFDIPVSALEETALTLIHSQPRVEVIATDAARRQYAFVQRTALLRFPDTITMRFVDLGDGRSSPAVYSRSKFGYSDLGANKRRVEAWLAAISRVAADNG